MTPEHRDAGFPDRWASLFKQRAPAQRCRWRVSFVAGVLRVSSKLGSSHRTLTTPVEAYAPPHTVHILPSCGSPSSTPPPATSYDVLSPQALLHGALYLAVGRLLGYLAAFV